MTFCSVDPHRNEGGARYLCCLRFWTIYGADYWTRATNGQACRNIWHSIPPPLLLRYPTRASTTIKRHLWTTMPMLLRNLLGRTRNAKYSLCPGWRWTRQELTTEISPSSRLGFWYVPILSFSTGWVASSGVHPALTVFICFSRGGHRELAQSAMPTFSYGGVSIEQ